MESITSQSLAAQPAIGARRPLELLQRSGLERLRCYVEGLVDVSPLEHLLGLRVTDAQPGAASYTMPVGRWLQDRRGDIGLGPLAVLADGALGGAIQTTLDPGFAMATISLWLTATGPMPAGGTLTAQGHVVAQGDGFFVAQGTIFSDTGNEVGRGMTKCASLPADSLPAGSVVNAIPEGSVAQHRRPRPEARYKRVPTDAPDPIRALIGLTTTSASEHSADLELAASPWFTSPAGSMQGGVACWAAERAFFEAVAAGLPAERIAAVDELTVTFLRPVMLGDGIIRASSTIEHRGRTRVSGRADVVGPIGKVVATATAGAVVRAAGVAK